MLRRLTIQIWRDLTWATDRLKEVDGFVKLLVATLFFLATGLGISVLAGQRWYVVLSALLTLSISFYLGSAYTRSRSPKLTVGPLVADLRAGSTQFHLKVKNRGPGNVKPKVTITEVTDGNGVPLTIGFSGWEPHWRSVTSGELPLLEEGDQRYAGILYVPYNKPEQYDEKGNPRLMTYPRDWEAQPPQALWEANNPPVNGVRLTLKFTCQEEMTGEWFFQTERTYHLLPDDTQRLKYKCSRVWFPAWGISKQVSQEPSFPAQLPPASAPASEEAKTTQ